MIKLGNKDGVGYSEERESLISQEKNKYIYKKKVFTGHIVEGIFGAIFTSLSAFPNSGQGWKIKLIIFIKPLIFKKKLGSVWNNRR